MSELEKAEKMNLHQGEKTAKLVKMAMLAAISVVLVGIIHFPIFPMAPFLEYDPADIPIFIGTFAYGPMAGLVLTVLVSIIQGSTVSAASGLYGIIMHILATGAFSIVAGNLYKKHKDKKSAVIALCAGVGTMVIVMILANLIVTPYFMMVPVSAVAGLMLPAIIPFNILKGGVNAVITFLVYKRISKFLHR